MVYRSVIESNDIGPFEKVNQIFSWILLPEPQFIRRAAPFATNQTHKSTWSKLFFSVLNCNLCELVRTSRQIVCRNSRAPQFGIASSSDVSMWGACIMIGIWDASKAWKGRSFLKKAVGDFLRGLPGTLDTEKGPLALRRAGFFERSSLMQFSSLANQILTFLVKLFNETIRQKATSIRPSIYDTSTTRFGSFRRFGSSGKFRS